MIVDFRFFEVSVEKLYSEKNRELCTNQRNYGTYFSTSDAGLSEGTIFLVEVAGAGAGAADSFSSPNKMRWG